MQVNAEKAGGVARIQNLESLPEDADLAELPNGMTIVHQNWRMTSFLFAEIFKEGCYFQKGIKIGPQAIVVDVGANIGLFTLCVALRQPTARIYALEPIPQTYHVLQCNAHLWAPGAIVDNRALGRAEESAVFTHYPEFSGASGRYADPASDEAGMNALALHQARDAQLSETDSSFIQKALAPHWRSEVVVCRVTTLSKLMSEYELPRIDLLKIDAEGSEVEILQGVDARDWHRIQQVVLEVHSEILLNEARKILEAEGFSVFEPSACRGTETRIVYAMRDAEALAKASQEIATPPWLNTRQIVEELERYLRCLLPDAIVPRTIQILPALPLTPSGKIDRAALATISSATKMRPAHVEPRNEVERTIASIWSELLRLPSVGASDDFFDLGGHSLLAIQSLSRIRAVFPVDIPLRLLFDAPTVWALADEIIARETVPGQLERAAQIYREIDTMSPEAILATLEELPT